MALLELAKAAGASAGEQAQEQLAGELELLPKKERKRREREGVDARRRSERRARTRTLDLTLSLSELWLRDVLCICAGAPELVHAGDRLTELQEDARDRDGARVCDGIGLVGDTRLSLTVNVSEELALEALAYRLESLLAA
jgi:DNA polymerase-3 subunit delta'